ncbi:hypothetical protein [Cupriavidus plantarum]|uniref:hypothetical protein n=1 Tax=Cupriavidus plantarum TaxID=942865 RepID=UPI000EB30ABC|nr:hypothetical protein [Cupriavidus plantarum]RLK30000.1 hypothetical protein C7417_5103 [Cupriavidus plantarum]CAG2144604.1 hypothetical protein LMG26296_03566 [Cupriavidus plantarum]
MEKQSKRSTASTEPLNPGVRTDKQQVKSRSADPGQSSYGGFKNEDTRRQHQTDAKGGNGKS